MGVTVKGVSRLDRRHRWKVTRRGKAKLHGLSVTYYRCSTCGRKVKLSEYWLDIFTREVFNPALREQIYGKHPLFELFMKGAKNG